MNRDTLFPTNTVKAFADCAVMKKMRKKSAKSISPRPLQSAIRTQRPTSCRLAFICQKITNRWAIFLPYLYILVPFSTKFILDSRFAHKYELRVVQINVRTESVGSDGEKFVLVVRWLETATCVRRTHQWSGVFVINWEFVGQHRIGIASCNECLRCLCCGCIDFASNLWRSHERCQAADGAGKTRG